MELCETKKNINLNGLNVFFLSIGRISRVGIGDDWKLCGYSSHVFRFMGCPILVWVSMKYVDQAWVSIWYADLVWISVWYADLVWVSMRYTEPVWVSTRYRDLAWVFLLYADPVWVSMMYRDLA